MSQKLFTIGGSESFKELPWDGKTNVLQRAIPHPSTATFNAVPAMDRVYTTEFYRVERLVSVPNRIVRNVYVYSKLKNNKADAILKEYLMCMFVEQRCQGCENAN